RVLPATKGENRGRPERPPPCEPHRCRPSESTKNTPAQPLPSRAPRERHLGRQRPHASADGGHLHMDRPEVGKWNAGVSWKVDVGAGARRSKSQNPNPKSQNPKRPRQHLRLGFGTWDLGFGIYQRTLPRASAI